MTRCLCLLLILLPVIPTAADGPASYDFGNPTAEEQLGLELINRARKDPEAERVRLGVAEAAWPAYPARPPLVMNAALLSTARAHARDMHDREYFDHVNPEGLNANGRVRAAGYPLSLGYPGDGENSVENLAAGHLSIEIAHDKLMLDEGIDPPNHRRIVLSDSDFGLWESNDEVGVGIFTGPKGFQRYYAFEFAHDGDPTPFLTGVCYEDRNGNGSYDPGEGLGGVTIETLAGGYSTTTADAGGWAIPVGNPATYTVRARGGALAVPVEKVVTIGAESVKVDFVIDVPEIFVPLKSAFRVDFKKRAKGKTDVDSLTLKAQLEEDRLPFVLDGVSVSVEFGDLTLGPYTLVAKGNTGKFRSAKGSLPRETITLSGKSGKLKLKVKKADLMDDLGLADQTVTTTKSYDVRILVGTEYDATGRIEHTLRSTAGKKAKGTAP